MEEYIKTSADGWDLSGIFDYKGQKIHYGILGEGSPLVLLHGFPFSSLVWRRIAPYLARHRKVYYFDLLGLGQSEKREKQDVSLGVQNQVFAALLDHWELKKPDVVAHDIGGATALRAHLLNECQYRSLTLIDPVALSPWGSAFVKATKAHEKVFAELPAYIHEAILEAYINDAVQHPLADDVMKLYTEPLRDAEGQAAFYRQIAQMDDRYTDEIQDDYGKIKCPAQIIWGENDKLIPFQRGQILVQRIPNAKLHIVSEAGHLVQEDAPEAITATVLDFLASVK